MTHTHSWNTFNSAPLKRAALVTINDLSQTYGSSWLMENSKASSGKYRDPKDKYSRGLQSGCNYTDQGFVAHSGVTQGMYCQ